MCSNHAPATIAPISHLLTPWRSMPLSYKTRSKISYEDKNLSNVKSFCKTFFTKLLHLSAINCQPEVPLIKACQDWTCRRGKVQIAGNFTEYSARLLMTNLIRSTFCQSGLDPSRFVPSSIHSIHLFCFANFENSYHQWSQLSGETSMVSQTREIVIFEGGTFENNVIRWRQP